MRRFLVLLLLCPFFTTSAYAEGIYEQAAELADVYAVESALTPEERAVGGELTVDGSYDTQSALRRLWEQFLAALTEQLRENLRGAGQLIAIAILASLLCSLSVHGGVTPMIEIGACCIVSLLLAGGVESMTAEAVQTLARLSDYSKAALPAIFSAAAFSGAVASASARYAAVCLAMDVIMSVQNRLVLPLVYAFLAVAVSRSVFDNGILAAVSRFLKWCITTALTAVTLCFSAYLSVTGVIAGSTDAVAVKAARTAISTALPVVGGLLSDSASVILAAAGVIRSAAGAFSLVAICALCIGPFVALSVKMLLFKMSAAVTEMLPLSRLSRLIGDLGSVYGMLLGMIGSCGIMLFLSIMSGIKAVTA